MYIFFINHLILTKKEKSKNTLETEDISKNIFEESKKLYLDFYLRETISETLHSYPLKRYREILRKHYPLQKVDSKGLAGRFKKIRLALGLSQEKFGFMFGTNAQRVYEIEKGHSYPSKLWAINIEHYFNICMNWFLTGEGGMFKYFDSDEEEKLKIAQKEIKKLNTRIEFQEKIIKKLL